MYRDLDREPSYALTKDEIDRHVKNDGPGRFVLGFCDARGAFRIQFVGRAERNPKATLRGLVGTYRAFKFTSDSFDKRRQ